MKNMRKIWIAVLACTILVVASITAFSATTTGATGFSSSAEILADLTGKSTDEIWQACRDTGKSCGQLAYEAGVGEEFAQASAEMKIQIIKQQVACGKITREQADALLENVETNLANCTANGAGAGSGLGLGLGARDGSCQGRNAGAGYGNGGGYGCRAGRGSR